MVEIPTISVEDFAQRLGESGQEHLQLIDVREPAEAAIAAVPGFTLLPLSQYNDWAAKIHQQFDASRETIVMCHHGMRSAQMCQWLIDQGFTQVHNLVGGIDAYAQRVDPQIPRY
jgi:rhodanese-related sulfurtransferase